VPYIVSLIQHTQGKPFSLIIDYVNNKFIRSNSRNPEFLLTMHLINETDQTDQRDEIVYIIDVVEIREIVIMKIIRKSK
jgi:hypothetical protein